jgi:hypothetical protein
MESNGMFEDLREAASRLAEVRQRLLASTDRSTVALRRQQTISLLERLSSLETRVANAEAAARQRSEKLIVLEHVLDTNLALARGPTSR